MHRDLVKADSGEIRELIWDTCHLPPGTWSQMSTRCRGSRRAGHSCLLGATCLNSAPEDQAQRCDEGSCAIKAPNTIRGIWVIFVHVFKNPPLDLPLSLKTKDEESFPPSCPPSGPRGACKRRAPLRVLQVSCWEKVWGGKGAHLREHKTPFMSTHS